MNQCGTKYKVTEFTRQIELNSREKFCETVKPRPQTYCFDKKYVIFNFLFCIISESFRIIELFVDTVEA